MFPAMRARVRVTSALIIYSELECIILSFLLECSFKLPPPAVAYPDLIQGRGSDDVNGQDELHDYRHERATGLVGYNTKLSKLRQQPAGRDLER